MRFLPLSLSYFVLSVTLFSIFSCSTSVSCGSDKDAFVNNFYSFVEEIRDQQKKGTITESQWTNYDAQFKKLTETCYKEHEAQLNTSDKLGVASSVGFYFYAKYGLAAALQLAKTDAAIKQILMEIDYTVLFSAAKEILNNPDEIRKIMGDLEKRYGE